MGVDGILYTSVSRQDELAEDLLDQGYPIVFANRGLKSKRGDRITFDHVYGTYLGITHLFNLGYRRIACMHGSVIHSTGFDRLEGYRKAITEKKLKFDKTIVAGGSYDQESGYEFGKHLINHPRPPDAVFCSDDFVALGGNESLGRSWIESP